MIVKPVVGLVFQGDGLERVDKAFVLLFSVAGLTMISSNRKQPMQTISVSSGNYTLKLELHHIVGTVIELEGVCVCGGCVCFCLRFLYKFLKATIYNISCV